MAIVGFALSIAGVEYLFTTSGVSSLPTSSDSEWSTAWSVLEHALDWSQGVSWGVRARSDGSLETDSVTFTILDVVPSTGSAAGQNVGTYLFTRRPALLNTTRLTSDLTAGGATLTVYSVASLSISSYPTTVYVDREAVRVSGSGSATTLTVAGGGRGYWGTLAQAHDVDADNLIYPVVWAALPTIVRRKVLLWAIDDSNTATAIWRGTVGVGPALHADGAAFDLQCEGIWTSVAGQRVGRPAAICRFHGYWGGQVGVLVYRDGGYIGGGTGGTSHYHTLATLCARARVSLRASLPSDTAVTFTPFAGGLRAIATSTSGSNLQVELLAGEQRITSNSTGTSGTRTAIATIPRVPSAILRAQVGSYNNSFPVDGLTDLPASWTPSTYTDHGYTTTVKPSLRCEYGGDAWVVFDIAGSGNQTTPSASDHRYFTGPYLQAAMSIVPRGGVDPPAASAREVVAEGDLRGKIITLVRADHFAAGLKRLLDSATTELRSSVNRYDWEWTVDSTALPRLLAATASAYAAREWEIDGSQTVSDILKEICATNGLALCLRGSRLAVVAIGPATRATTVAATLSETDLLADPTWQALAEEQITAIDIESDARNLRVVNATTEGTYGPGRSVAVKLEGQRAAARALSNYQDFVRYMMARLQGPYAEPIAALTIKVAASQWMTTIKCGDYVDVSEWLAPAGDGTRGVGNASSLAAFAASTARAQVVGWDPDLTAGADGESANALTLTLLLFPQVTGYPPACKVASSPNTTSVVVATAYINSAGEYTNPDASESDGGASKFAAGDVVRFRLMDSTSDTTYGPYTIQSVSSTTITFTGAIDATLRTAIAGGDWYDLVYAYASEIDGGANETSQLGYAFCGDDTSGVIGGTSYANQTWAP